MTGRVWIVALLLAGCAEATRLDDADRQPPSLEEAGLRPVDPTRLPPPQIGSPLELRPAPVPEVVVSAAEDQIRRLDRSQADVARVPATQPVPGADLAQLRRQRQQAQAIAAQIPPSRPTLHHGSGRPDFSMPSTATADALNRSIQRARTAEARALSRSPGF